MAVLDSAACESQLGPGAGGGDGSARYDVRQMLMSRHARRIDDRAAVRPTSLGGAVCAVLVAVSAFAQEIKTEPQNNAVVQPPAAPPPVAPSPNGGFQPGFIDVFGRFIGDSASKLNSRLKSAQDTLGDLGNQSSSAAKGAVSTAKDAAGAIIGLPNARIVTGRERCAAAPFGAPDCRAAADTACRGKGFASGTSLDTQTTQKCPARVWLSGRLPAEGECALETFVTRAVCR